MSIVNPYKGLSHILVYIGASQGSCAVLAYHVLINEKTLQVFTCYHYICYVIVIVNRATLVYYWKQNVLS